MKFSWRRFAVIVLVCSLAGSSLMAFQSGLKSVSDGVYTAEQATRGQAVYKAQCANCHGDTLIGRNVPSLTGDDFIANWNSGPLLDLSNKIRLTMPKNNIIRLTPQEVADVLAYILQVDKFPAGRTELSVTEAALKQMTLPTTVKKAPAVAAQGTVLAPTGTVAQVMRGILFPSSNILFTTQSIDPGAKKEIKDDAPGGGFDWLTWGGGVYAGWEVVDYAAVAISESASLMLAPGRRCENGKIVPVTDPDWIKFSMELEAAGKAAYKASQTRKQETISDSTNQLNDSCMHCHQVYRGRTHCQKG